MKTVDLREVTTFWATIEKNKDRHTKMVKMFDELGFKDTHQVNGPIANPYTVGIAETHIQSLQGNLPVLMMEDDCAVTSDWNPILDIPEGVDAVYLGTSWFGMVRGKSQYQGCISSSYNDKFVKPYNMLGIHSILYLSEKYRDHVVKLLSEFKDNPGSAGCDECVATHMKDYNILAVKNPYFYQNDGHSNEETLRPLNPYF
jgi:hypothetical protein